MIHNSRRLYFKGRLLVAFGGEWSVGFLTKHNPGLVLAESLSV